VTAVTINSVTVNEPDTFYSNVTGNNIVNLMVSVTSDVTVSSVTADFPSSGFCKGQSGHTIGLTSSDGNNWNASCDVTDNAASVSTQFSPIPITINAVDSNGSSVYNNTIISLYNVAIPAGTSDGCYRFGSGSMDFSTISNFSNINTITLIIEVHNIPSCVPGYTSGDWLTVGKVIFTSPIDLSNPLYAQKLAQLSSIVKLYFSSSKTYQNTKFYIDISQLPPLGTSTSTSFYLYHLAFSTPGKILNDYSQVIPSTWTSNGNDSLMNNAATYNVAFSVSSVSGGYAAVDNVPPNVSIVSPTDGQILNSTSVLIDALINGTGTEVSQALFYINNVSNTAACTQLSADLFNCSLALTENDGSYNLTVVGYDYGGTSGNNANVSESYAVETGAPSITVTSPTSGTTYTGVSGSMLILNFNAIDGNGIDSCRYTLAGPTTANNVLINNCTDNNSVQLYLSSGAYNLTLTATDTLGMASTTNVSFIVNDAIAPVMTDNSPTPSSTDAILSVITDESSACKYDTIDSSYTDMRYALDGGLNIHNDTVSLTKDELSDYYVRCSDLSSNVDITSLHVQLLYGTNNNTQNNTQSKSDPSVVYNLGSLPAGTKVIAVDKFGIPLLNLFIVTNKVASDVSINITAVSNPLANYSEKVYKYVTIDHATLSDDSISSVKIKFFVDKSWLKDNNINESDIILFRYANGVWTPLNTTLTRNDAGDSVIYYLADSPGLSLFAISIKSQAVVTNTALTANASNNTGNTTTDNSLLSKRHINWFWVILLSIIIFIMLVLFVLVQRNDRRSPPIFPEDRTPWGRVRRLFK